RRSRVAEHEKLLISDGRSAGVFSVPLSAFGPSRAHLLCCGWDSYLQRALERLRMLLRLLAVLFVVIATVAAGAAEKPSGVTGLFLTTRYPALTVRTGETTTIDLSLRNFNLPPQELALSVPQLASGWKATVLGGGQPIESAIVGPDSEEKLQLRLEPPSSTGPGNYGFMVEARGDASTLKLPVTVTIGQELPAKLKLTTNFPALRGTATTSFKFKVSVANDSGRDATINFSADAPKNFQVT